MAKQTVWASGTTPVPELSEKDRKRLAGPQLSNAFAQYDYMFPSFDGGRVFDYQWNAPDIKAMLSKSGKARSAEQVLTLPLRSAKWVIQGDGPGKALVDAVLGDKLDVIIDQMTGAVAYKKAYFELVWKLDQGRVVYDQVAWRPPASCEAGFNPTTGAAEGFRQRMAHPAGVWVPAEGKFGAQPGYVYIPAQRAFIYTHGTHRDPIHGVSDLDVAYWAYETRQKILFLWFRYLEHQSLPTTLMYGRDPTTATSNADTMAELKAGGTAGMEYPPEGQKAFDIIESSGKGADQFLAAIKYLETQMLASVLAGFTELADNSTASRVGSYALSQDQSEFFLASRQAVADEMADAIRWGLFAPLVWYNLGPTAEVPELQIGPLANADTQRALDMLKSVIVAPALNVSGEFVDELVATTADYLGLPQDKIDAAIAKHAKQRDAEDARKQQVADAQAKAVISNGGVAPMGTQQTQFAKAKQGKPAPGKPPQKQSGSTGQPTTPKVGRAKMSATTMQRPQTQGKAKGLSRLVDGTDVLYELVSRTEQGESPESVLRDL